MNPHQLFTRNVVGCSVPKHHPFTNTMKNNNKKRDPWVIQSNNKSLSQQKGSVAANKDRTVAKHKIIRGATAAQEHDSRRALQHHDAAARAATTSRVVGEVIDLTSDNEQEQKQPVIVAVQEEKSIFVDLQKKKKKPKTNNNQHDALTLQDRSQFNVSAAGSLYEKAASRRARHRCVLMQESAESRNAAIPLRKSGATTASRPALPEYKWDDAVPLVPKINMTARHHPGKTTATIYNRMVSSNKESYAPLMAGQVLPTTKQQQQRRRGSDKSRQRLSEKLLGKRSRR